MKDFRAFLLSGGGWQDGAGNTLVFSEKGLLGEQKDGEIWLFLDEGLRCGGMHRPIAPVPEKIREALLGIGKDALWAAIAADWEKEDGGCSLKN